MSVYSRRKTALQSLFFLGIMLFSLSAFAGPVVKSLKLTSSSVRGYNSSVQVQFDLCLDSGDATTLYKATLDFYYADSSAQPTTSSLASNTRDIQGKGCVRSSQTFTLPNTVLAGKRYIHVKMNAQSKTIWARPLELTITGKPDLRVTSLYVTPQTVQPGSAVTVYYRLYNYGYSRAAGPIVTRFYDSSDVTINNSDTKLTPEGSLKELLPFQSTSTLSVKITLPTGTRTGTRYLGAYIDPDNKISEVSETNNTRYYRMTLVDYDLTVNVATVPSTATGYGARINVSISVKNLGNGVATGFYVTWYYADSLTSATSALRSLGSSFISSVNGKSNSSTIRTTLTIPNTALFGKRAIHYFIDSSSRIPETNENNNRGAKEITISRQPNLRVYSLYASPTRQAIGGKITLSYTLYNDGYSRADGVVFRVYESQDSTITTSDRLMSTSKALSLAARATNRGTITITVPSGVSGRRYLGILIDPGNVVKETNETDNTRAAYYDVTASVPELVMSSWTSPSTSLGAGTTFTVSFDVKNTGKVNAGSFSVGVYYGTSTSTSGLRLLGRKTIASLAAGNNSGRQTLTISLPTNVVAGQGYIHYYIDEYSRVSELDETNNRGYRAITVTGKPNLTVTAFTVTPTTQVPGGQLTFTYTVKNTGNVSANTSYLRFYLSKDAVITAADTAIGNSTVSTLDVGQSRSATVRVTLSSTTVQATYTVGAFADYLGRIAETSENDNIRTAKVTISTQIADLKMSVWNTLPTAKGCGTSLTITFRIQNAGSRDAGAFEVRFYYTPYYNNSYQAVELGKLTVSSLKANTTSGDLSVAVTLPDGVANGRRSLMYEIDATNKVAESSESNNRGFRTLTISGKPNLQPTVLSVTPTTQAPRGTVTFTFEITNIGSAVAGTSYARFYYSTDATITTSDTYLTYRTIGTLGCGAVFKGTATAYLPSNARTGKAWVGIFADYSNRVAESDETDNAKGVAININSSVPDLSMASLLVGTSIAGAGSKLPVSFTVRNTGKAKAGAFKVQFYYNTSTSRTGWVPVGNPVSVAAIDPGKTSSLAQIQLTMPSTVRAGTGYLHYFVDSGNDVGEYSESNNYSYRTFRVTGQADLSASVLRLTPNAQAPGGLLRIEYRIVNSGMTKADNFQLSFYYSTDATINSSDASLGQVTVTTVASMGGYPATGNATLTVRLPSNARIGTGYIGVIVDSTRRVSESNENNNIRAEKIAVTSPGPDLVPSTVVLPSAPVIAGQKVTISVTVSNLGSASSGVTTGSVVYSTDGLIDAGDKAVGTFAIPALSSKASSTISVSITMPTGLNAGNGYIGVIVDSTQKVKETVETNNTATRIVLIVEDKDKDGFAWAPGCPTIVKDCDCDDTDKAINPKATETCDGKDNNCDGKIDPTPPCGCTSGQQRACYSGPAGTDGKGTCKKGTQSCTNGKWGSCVGETKPKPEDCNGKDDDCDGQVDENLAKQKCYSGAAGTAGKGACQEGTRSCSNGQWSTCVGEVLPSAEKCDGKDNDCDGQIDNAFNTSNSLKQSCASACGVGLETCTNGTWQGCTAPQNCGEPQPEPNPDGNEPPADLGEPTGDAGADTVPEGGNCYTNGCPSGEICQKGQCVADPCDGVNCSGKGEYCRDGQCVQSCGCTTCPSGELCIDGQCTIDPCDGVTCKQDEICDNTSGQCVKNNCASGGCGDKRTCINGSCVDDPCLNIQCPQGDVCDKGQCVGQQCSSEPGQENTSEPTTDVSEPTVDADGGVTTDASEPTTDKGTTDKGTNDQGSTDNGATDQGTKDAGQQDKTSGDTTSGTDLKQLPEVPQGCNCSLSPTTPPSFLLFFALLAFFGAARRFRR